MASRSCGVTTVGIIGSAGRRADAKKMTKEIFHEMLDKVEQVITKQFRLDLRQVSLVSGGAAWADHVAVLEYLQNKVAGLKLHLPTTWHQDDSSPRFLDNDDSNIYNNPGRSANKLHRQFTDKIGEDSLKHIQSAVYLGAKYCVHKGFKERNTAVARDSKYLVAFTWSDGKAPKEESGTYDTWRKHTGTKIHVPISSLACVEGHKSIRSFFAKSSRNPDNSSSTSKADIGIAAQRLTDPQSCVAALGEGKPACVDSGCEMSQGSSSESSQSQTSQEPEGGVKEKATVGLKHSLDFGPSNTSIKKPKHPP